MTNLTVTLNAESKQYGAHNQYIAQITGKNAKFGFERAFVGRKNGCDSTAVVDEPGLYEICNIDKKGRKGQVYRIVAFTPDGNLIALPAGAGNADEQPADTAVALIARRLDNGEPIADIIELVPAPGTDCAPGDSASTAGWLYRVRTKTEAKKATAAATSGAAIEACWQILSALPGKMAKDVLKTLKARLAPPPAPKVQEATATPDAQDQIAGTVNSESPDAPAAPKAEE